MLNNQAVTRKRIAVRSEQERYDPRCSICFQSGRAHTHAEHDQSIAVYEAGAAEYRDRLGVISKWNAYQRASLFFASVDPISGRNVYWWSLDNWNRLWALVNTRRIVHQVAITKLLGAYPYTRNSLYA